MLSRSIFLLIFLLMFCQAHAALAAPILVNGSLEGPIANSAVPADWYVTSFSPDTMDESNNIGVIGLGDFGATPSPSPDGGTWVGLFMVGTTVEKFAQDVAGFAIGQSYELSWYHSNFGYAFSTHDVAIEVFVDGASIGTGPSLSLGTGWFSESLTFVATDTTHTIEFGSVGPVQSYTGIDGIAVSVVPEPSTFLLLSLGLFGVAAFGRRSAG